MQSLLEFAKDVLADRFDGRRVPLVRKKRHIYVEKVMNNQSTRADLSCIHRNFAHASAERPYAVIR